MNIKPSELLKKAFALIDTEGKFARAYYAKLKDGGYCSWDDPRAHSFCSIGAMNKVAKQFYHSTESYTQGTYFKARLYLQTALQKIGNRSSYVNIVAIQDSLPYDDVVQAWKLAIMNAEKDESIEASPNSICNLS